MNRADWALRLRRAAEAGKDILFPEEALCRACGTVCASGCLCARCRRELREGGAAFAWAWRDLEGIPAYSLRPHDGVARCLVIRLKHRAEACIAEELAGLVEPLPAFLSFSPDTVVTWVPMPRRRMRERCIDHGRVLAEAFARRLGLPCRALLRRRDDRSRTQARLSREQRMRNLRDVYAPAEAVSFPVLLVDDVLTTGTTALRCAGALRQGGAREIAVLTVTHSVR